MKMGMGGTAGVTSGRSRVIAPARALVFMLLFASVGLETPVLSLLLLARGATLATLPTVVGLTLVVTAACEVPSGVAADALGRRALFGCAMALQIAAHLVLLAPAGVVVVAVSCALRGLALAMRTGTLEAIEIDRVVEECPDPSARLAALDALNGRFALFESVGTGAGALIGGVLASIDASYTLLIWAVIGMSAVTFTMAFALFPRDKGRADTQRVGVRGVLASMRATITAPGDVRLVLMGSAAAGIVMLTVETYWQLSFQALVGSGSEWLLGPINCAGMVAAAVGSAAAMRWGAALSGLLGCAGRRRLYVAAHVVAALCTLMLGVASSVGLFVMAYLGYYVFIAARGVIEQTVLHNAVPSDERAGMASVQSLALRGGGALASATGAQVVAAFGISGVWPVYVASSLALTAAAVMGNRSSTSRCER